MKKRNANRRPARKAPRRKPGRRCKTWRECKKRLLYLVANIPMEDTD